MTVMTAGAARLLKTYQEGNMEILCERNEEEVPNSGTVLFGGVPGGARSRAASDRPSTIRASRPG